jgi:hypothetical protein
MARAIARARHRRSSLTDHLRTFEGVEREVEVAHRNGGRPDLLRLERVKTRLPIACGLSEPAIRAWIATGCHAWLVLLGEELTD